MPEDGLIGSKGALLYAQVNTAEKFFTTLNRKIAETQEFKEVSEQLSIVFSDYFSLSQAVALVTEMPTGDEQQPAVSPLDMAVQRLSEIFSIDRKDLVMRLRKQRQEVDPLRLLAPECPIDAKDGDRLALACALYLLGWEELQRVNGELARSIALGAISVMHRSDRRLISE